MKKDAGLRLRIKEHVIVQVPENREGTSWYIEMINRTGSRRKTCTASSPLSYRELEEMLIEFVSEGADAGN